MNIKNIINKLLKKTLKNYQEQSELVSILDTSYLPTRELFKENFKILKLINLYKNLYKEKLKSKIFTSHDLKIDEIVEDMNMNIDLVLKHCLYEDNKNEIDYQVDYAKLNLYLQEIENLEIRNTAKFIALNELSKNIKNLFSMNRRNAINQELTSLLYIMNIFKSQKVSVKLEIENYKNEIIHNNVDKKINNINERKDNAIKYGSMVLPHELLENYTDTYLSMPVYTAIIERALEIYVYKNKSLINNLQEELQVLKNTPKTTENKDKLLEKIKKLECQFQLFDLYGFNLINKEDLMSFYRVKFDIITIDINHQDKSPITCRISSYEFKCYEEIIAEKLRDIYNGHGIEVEKFIKIKSLRNFIKVLDNLLKDNKTFDYGFILEHIEYLALVLAFDKYDGLKNYFLEVKVSAFWNYSKFFGGYVDQITFDRKIPLETICKVIDSFDKKNEMLDKYNYDIYALYLFKQMIYSGEKNYSNECKIPEGIKTINNLDTDDPYPFLKDIREKIKNNTTVIFPSTLKEISGKLFGTKDVSINKLILNEGLEYIDDYTFYNQHVETIIIPSTLDKIKLGTFDYQSIIKLKFTNFKNSRVLSDLLYSDDYKSIIEKMFYVIETTTNNFAIASKLHSIELYDESGNWFYISLRKFNMNYLITIFNNMNNFYNNCLENDIKLIREYIINFIIKRTGYKIKPFIEDNGPYSFKILRKDKLTIQTM